MAEELAAQRSALTAQEEEHEAMSQRMQEELAEIAAQAAHCVN